MWLSAGLGWNAIGAITIDAHATQDAAEDGEACAGNKVEERIREVAGKVRKQEDSDASVDEDGEDVPQRASRHGVPPRKEESPG